MLANLLFQIVRDHFTWCRILAISKFMFIGDQLRPCHFMRDFNHFQFYFVLVLFDTHHFKRDFSLSYLFFLEPFETTSFYVGLQRISILILLMVVLDPQFAYVCLYIFGVKSHYATFMQIICKITHMIIGFVIFTIKYTITIRSTILTSLSSCCPSSDSQILTYSNDQPYSQILRIFGFGYYLNSKMFSG